MSFKAPILFCLILFVVIASALTANAKTTKVFLIAGQSNAAGVGRNSELYQPYVTANPDVKFWNGAWGDTTVGLGHDSTFFGPEIMFAQMLEKALPGEDIRLIKYAKSGTNLAVDWNPNGSGSQYNTFKSKVDSALANLDNSNIDYEIAGMIWLQGESDAFSASMANAYQANLTNFISTIRTTYGEADTPFVLGRITPFFGTPSYNALVRTAQVNVANADVNTTWFDTDTLEIASYNAGHYSTEGQLELGGLFAHHVLKTAGLSPATQVTQFVLRDASFEMASVSDTRNGHSPHWFDNSAAPAIFDPSNASFEGTTGSDGDVGPGGTNASSVLPDGGQVAFVFNGSTLSQTLDAFATPGNRYDLTFSVGQWLKTSLAPGDYRVQLLSGDLSIIDMTSDEINLGVAPDSGTFDQITLTGIADDEAMGVLRIVFTSLSGNDAITFFDDIQLSTQIPEPATMMLLGVGGLVAMRRRHL